MTEVIAGPRGVVWQRPVRYVVSAVPPGHECAPVLSVRVEARPGDLWAVTRRERVYCRSDAHRARPRGVWDRTGDVTDWWRRTYWLPLDQALRLARRVAPRLTVAGMTAADALAQQPTIEEAQ